jgi:hypothetical protein
VCFKAAELNQDGFSHAILMLVGKENICKSIPLRGCLVTNTLAGAQYHPRQPSQVCSAGCQDIYTDNNELSAGSFKSEHPDCPPQICQHYHDEHGHRQPVLVAGLYIPDPPILHNTPKLILLLFHAALPVSKNNHPLPPVP